MAVGKGHSLQPGGADFTEVCLEELLGTAGDEFGLRSGGWRSLSPRGSLKRAGGRRLQGEQGRAGLV